MLNDILLCDIKEGLNSLPGKEDGDYMGKDGLLYCGKCNTRKERKHVFKDNGETFVHRIACKCKMEEFEREDRELKEHQKAIEIERIKNSCFDDREAEKLLLCTFMTDNPRDEHEQEISKMMKKYCDTFESHMKPKGLGLVLYSPIKGNGKTYMAAAICNELISKGVKCRMTSLMAIEDEIRGTYDSGEIYEKYLKPTLLVIDDLGRERKKDFVQEITYKIINSRYNAKLPTIFTTNMDLKKLIEPDQDQDERIYDRIYDMCHFVEFKGKSRRKEKFINRYKQVDKFLKE